MAITRARMQALADKLTNKTFLAAKYPITITNAGSYDPITEAVTGSTNQTLAATLLEFDQRQIDGSNIKIGDKQALILNSELTIDIKDNTSEFSFDLSAGGMGIYSGMIIRANYDPLGVTATVHLRGVTAAVTLPPTVDTNPVSQTVDEYAQAVFTGLASGSGTIAYQWRKAGLPVGTDSGMYTLTSATSADNGASIDFVATNAYGSAASTAATLTVTSYNFVLDGLTQSFYLGSYINVGSSGDFEIEIEMSATQSAAHILSDSQSGANARLYYVEGSRVEFATSGGSVKYTLGAGVRPELLAVRRVSNVVTMSNNGSALTVDGSSSNGASFKYDSVGNKWGAFTSLPLLDGTVARFRMWTGGDRNSGTLEYDSKFNNKGSGATQAATVGGDATIQNYNVAGWQAI